MLIEEARWFAKQLAQYPDDALSPLLNVGSSSGHFRTVQQPWIDREIFGPLAARGIELWHLDLKEADGVALSGDLLEPHFRADIAARTPRAAFCSNLFEHVVEREALAAAIVEVLPANALIFASSPYRYPYHPDPIDTGFRPTVADLAALFPTCELLGGELVRGSTFWEQINQGPRALLKLALRLLLPVYRPRRWASIIAHLPWLGRHFEASCVVLRTGATQ